MWADGEVMYADVNTALAKALLSGRYDARSLYLVLDNRARTTVARSLDCDVDDVDEVCCAAVSKRLRKSGDPYAGFHDDMLLWRACGRKTLPPFTGLLYLLSHAAELMVSDSDFRASNYYQRLASLTGCDIERLRSNGKSTEIFWTVFNKWLVDNDFRFGRPTARAVNTNKYVGIAMSQAIVREADRLRFHDMFDKYGFTGTDTITEEEIAQYIASWITTSKPTQQLKAAWAKPELRSRICEIAVEEVRDWSDKDSESRSNLDQRLSLAASFRKDLFSRAVTLWVGREAEIDLAGLVVKQGAGKPVQLSNSNFGNFATVEPKSSIDLALALTRGLVIEDPSGGSLRWNPRTVVPLSRSAKGNYWTEVNRVTVGVEHLVLVRADRPIKQAVDQLLGEAALPGYKIHSRDTIAGLPAGWLLYESVQVLRAVQGALGFELALVPVAESSGLVLSGGLKLSRGIWHAWSPPIAHCDADENEANISVWDGTSSDGVPLCSSGPLDDQSTLELANMCVPTDGALYVEARAGQTLVGSANLLLRSAARPRPLDRQERGELAYNSIADAVELGDEGGIVRGAICAETGVYPGDVSWLKEFTELGVIQLPDNEPLQLQVEYIEANETAPSIADMSRDELKALPCTIRGSHRWQYEYLPPGTPKYAPVSAACLGCGISRLETRRPVAGHSGNALSALSHRARPTTSTKEQGGALPFDLWMDALCFLGHGTAASTETIVSQSEVDEWRAAAMLRDLNWLGHIDVAVSSNHRPKRWSVAPPALVFNGNDTAFLAGFRNLELLKQLAEVAIDIEAVFEKIVLPGQPELVRVSDFPYELAAQVLGHIRDPHGRTLEISAAVPDRILSACSSFADLSSTFAVITPGKPEQLQRFDPVKAKWRSVETLQELGGYRFAHAGTTYCVVDGSGNSYSGPHELVKLAAARSLGVRLHAYDPIERVFVSRLGCEPVGLLGRALVLSSGRLPTIADGLSRFHEVTPEVAAAVLEIMYLGDVTP